MKITRKQLRYLIREAAQHPYGLAEDHALINNWLPGNTHGIFILFDAKKALSDIREINDNNDTNVNFYYPILENIKGMIQIDQMLDNNKNPYGAYQVSYSTAAPGYGPLMYDLVMSVVPGGIYPDRRDVSKSARKVWKYYADNRPDVVKSYIDDFADPKTDYEYDDGIRHGAFPTTPADAKEYERFNIPFQPSRSFGNKNLPPTVYLNMVYSIPGADVNQNNEVNLMEDNYNFFLKMVDSLEIKSDAMKYYKKNRTHHPIESVKALTGLSLAGLRQRYFGTHYRGSAG